jgi:type II secretory pathway component PulC
MAAGLATMGFAGQPPQPVPDSALPLRLLGIMADAAVPSRSACLIRCSYPIETSGIVATGQVACDIAEIVEVRQDEVVIRNLLTNRRELLKFPKTKPGAATEPATGTASKAGAVPSSPPPVVATSKDVVTVELPKDAVRGYLQNLPDLLESAFASPRYLDVGNGPRVIDGFEISRIRPGSLVEQMGFKDGDVVLDLNGQKIDGVPTALRLLGEVQNLAQARMTVLRDGRKMTFVFIRK